MLKPAPVHPGLTVDTAALFGPESAVRSIPPEYQELFDDYTRGPARLRAALAGLNGGALNLREPGSDWTIRDIVTHLSDAESAFSIRVRHMIAEENPVIPAFDEDVWKRRLQYLWRDVDASLALFQANRFATAEILAYAGKNAWHRTGQHSEDGEITVLELVRRAANHVHHHVAQIERARSFVSH